MDILKNGIPVGLCSDHAGYELKNIIEGWLDAQGIAYKDFGTYSAESCDYADFAHPCALALEAGEVYPAIAICGSGNGIGMTRNKHPPGPQHNDANCLVLAARFIEPEVAIDIVDAFLHTEFEGGRHARRVAKIPVQ